MAWRGALSRNLQELRDFVMSSYQELKKLNPTFPILIRECAGIEAKLVARYDFGREESVKVEGLAKADVAKQLEQLVERGAAMPRGTESEGDVATA